MPVVINDFEVVSEPAPAPPEQESRTNAPAPPTPHEIEAIVRRQTERLVRIRAT